MYSVTHLWHIADNLLKKNKKNVIEKEVEKVLTYSKQANKQIALYNVSIEFLTQYYR